MILKISKKQWQDAGKKAGWIKEAQMQNGQSALGRQVAQNLNLMIAKMGRPDLESQARSLASQLVALFDQADAQSR